MRIQVVARPFARIIFNVRPREALSHQCKNAFHISFWIAAFKGEALCLPSELLRIVFALLSRLLLTLSIRFFLRILNSGELLLPVFILHPMRQQVLWSTAQSPFG